MIPIEQISSSTQQERYLPLKNHRHSPVTLYMVDTTQNP